MDASAGLELALPSRRQVLVVDDEPQVLVALEDVLGDDYDVLKAETPEHALNVIERQPDVAVVISDQRMPGMSGDELLSRMSEWSDATRVMVTGYADLGAVIRAVNRGKIFAYVTKPWDSQELLLTIQKSVEHFELLRALAHERQLLEDLMNNTPDAIYFKNPEFRFQRVNLACARRLDLANPALAVGRRLGELGADPEQAKSVEREEAAVLSEGTTASDLVRREDSSAGRRFYSTTLAAVRGTSGRIQGLVGISRDVTAREETERALRRLTHVRTILGAVNSAIVRVKDRDALIQETCRIAVEDGGLLAGAILELDSQRPVVASAAAEGLGEAIGVLLRSGTAAETTWSPAAVIQNRRASIVSDLTTSGASPLSQLLLENGGQALGFFPLVAGERVKGVFVLVARQADFFDSEEVRLLSELGDNVASALDHIEKSARLDFLAYYDELTGLPKRNLLLDRLSQLLHGRSSGEGRLAIVLVDVSRFRHVNDTLGRGGGDELLFQISKRLTKILDDRDTLARFDSNAFAVLVAACGEESDLAAYIERKILGGLNAPFTIRETELRIAVRVGAAVFPSDATDAEGLLRNAEAALDDARRKAQRYLFYAPNMNARRGEKLTLETKLRRALDEQQFLLHYQPKVDLKTGRVVGLEALLRWRDPERGLISPAEFIPVLEETGLILDVGNWVLDAAAAQYASWRAEGLSPPRVAANVSGVQVAQRNFVQHVEAALARHPSARDGLDLELTESVLVEDLAGNIEKLRALKEQGVCIAVDDFGTGYSSLGYLSRLPIDALKIDRSFIVRMTNDAQDMTIVTTIISLARSLELKVIAEGVETAEQARLLTLVRCDQIQGYLIARPEPPETVVAHFGARKRTWPPADPKKTS
jgi:diguanylate cyclase (GGDEF)-like protein/PAS domain S-box-containing protein